MHTANALAHGGDAAFDKRFYQEAGRDTDERTFAALYGLFPVYALRLSALNFNPSLPHQRPQPGSAINGHASAKAPNLQKATPVYYERSQTLISAIQGALDDEEEAALSPSGTSEIGGAYHAFLLASNTEVSGEDRPARQRMFCCAAAWSAFCLGAGRDR